MRFPSLTISERAEAGTCAPFRERPSLRKRERRDSSHIFSFFFLEFALRVLSSFVFGANATTMSKKRSCDENVETPTTAKRVNIEHDARLWKLVTDHPNVFDAHIVTKLNGNDVKFFYDVNRESRAAIKRSGVQLPVAFKIGDFATTSTLSWALEKCSEKKERFCAHVMET